MKSIAKSKYKTINQLITEAYQKMNKNSIEDAIINPKILETNFEKIKRIINSSNFRLCEIDVNEIIDYCCNGKNIICRRSGFDASPEDQIIYNFVLDPLLDSENLYLTNMGFDCDYYNLKFSKGDFYFEQTSRNDDKDVVLRTNDMSKFKNLIYNFMKSKGLSNIRYIILERTSSYFYGNEFNFITYLNGPTDAESAVDLANYLKVTKEQPNSIYNILSKYTFDDELDDNE